MTIKNGGYAFPSDAQKGYSYPTKGMTLRDYFAAKAMQGLMDAAMPMSEIAKEAYIMANLMIAERDK